MCFYLFIAAEVPIPETPDIFGQVFFERLVASGYKGVEQHFTLPYQMGVVSTMGCGCGFRNEDFAPEDIVPLETFGWTSDDVNGGVLVDLKENGMVVHFANGEGQEDHNQLADYVQEFLKESKYVELYGCWQEYWKEPSEDREVISVNQLRHQHFYFRDRFVYKVTNDR